MTRHRNPPGPRAGNPRRLPPGPHAPQPGPALDPAIGGGSGRSRSSVPTAAGRQCSSTWCATENSRQTRASWHSANSPLPPIQRFAISTFLQPRTEVPGYRALLLRLDPLFFGSTHVKDLDNHVFDHFIQEWHNHLDSSYHICFNNKTGSVLYVKNVRANNNSCFLVNPLKLVQLFQHKHLTKTTVFCFTS